MHHRLAFSVLLGFIAYVACTNFTFTQKFGPVLRSDYDFVVPVGDALLLVQANATTWSVAIYPSDSSAQTIHATLELGPPETVFNGFDMTYGGGAVYFTNQVSVGTTTHIYNEFCNSTGCYPQQPLSFDSNSVNMAMTSSNYGFAFFAYVAAGGADNFWVGLGIDGLISNAKHTAVSPSVFSSLPLRFILLLSNMGTAIIQVYTQNLQFVLGEPFNTSTNLTELFQTGFPNNVATKFDCAYVEFGSYSFPATNDVHVFYFCGKNPRNASFYLILEWPSGVAFTDATASLKLPIQLSSN